MGVNRAGQDLASDFSEFLGLVIEGYDFGGADEGEVKGIEEEEDIFALVGAEVDLGEVAVVPGVGNELRGGFSDK